MNALARRTLLLTLALGAPGIVSAQDRIPNAVAVQPRQPTVYLASQVDRQARLLGTPPAPRYPVALRDARVSGQVLAQFVVDARGRVDSASFRVLRSSHGKFSEAVRERVVELRFAPARLKNRAVPQLVQMPFEFKAP